MTHSTLSGSLTSESPRALVERLLPKHVNAMYRVVQSGIWFDPELVWDIVQDACLRVLRYADAFDCQLSPDTTEDEINKRLRTWACSIAYRQAKTVGQREFRRRKLGVPLSDTDAVADKDDTLHKGDTVRTLLDRLPQKDREILELYYIGERTLQEVADLTGLALATVHGRLEAAKSKAAVVLKQLSEN